MEVTILKNPGLGFSIAGGLGSPGNPFKDDDVVSKYPCTKSILIVCPNKYQEITDVWSVPKWLFAYINVFFGKFET